MQKRIFRAFPPPGSPPARLPFRPSQALPPCSCPAFSPACSPPPPSRATATSSATSLRPASAWVRKRRAPTPRRSRRPRLPRKKPRRAVPRARLYRRLRSPPAASIFDPDRPCHTHGRLHRPSGTPHADWRLQRHRQGALAPLEHLLRRADAVHAAHHLVRRRHARRRRPGLSGLARLHPPSRRLRSAAIRYDQDGCRASSSRRGTLRRSSSRTPCCRCPRCSRPPPMPAEPRGISHSAGVELASMGSSSSTMATAAVPERRRDCRCRTSSQPDRLRSGPKEARRRRQGRRRPSREGRPHRRADRRRRVAPGTRRPP